MVWYEIVIRLFLAIILSGIIGFEREIHGRPAGLRTHVLVALGAALVMLISIDGFGGSGDPARLAAQVVSGIGFLGAGAIMRDSGGIRGITTATTLWIVGMIGLACGNGYYIGAIVTTLLVVLFILVLRPIEFRINNRSHNIIITCRDDELILAKTINVFDELEILIYNVHVDQIEKEHEKLLRIRLELSNSLKPKDLNDLIVELNTKVNPVSITSK